MIWQAVRHLRERRWIVRGSIAAGVLVLAQAALGGATVENNLHEVLVATHLGLAMLLLALVIGLRRIAAEPEDAPAAEGATRGLRTMAVIASVLVLATIVAGGLVAGTEEEGVARLDRGQRRPPRLRQGVSDLPRQLHAVRALAA